jgi:hypothetical protein
MVIEVASQRLTDAARRNSGSRWQTESTVPLPILNRPLMTPGQRWRSKNRG